MKILLARPRSPFPALHQALSLVGALGALQLACAGASSVPAPPPRLAPPAAEISPGPVRPVLRLEETVERELAGDGKDEHLLDLEAGWYARVVIDQSGLDVAATLLGPGGETVMAVDDPDDRREEETLCLVASAAGEHRLVVTPHDPKAEAGRYRVTLKELRPARPEDAGRVAAARGLAEVKLLRKAIQTGDAAETRETTEKALARAEEVLRLWRGVGDRSGEIETLIEIGFIQKEKEAPAEALAAFEEALTLATAPEDRRRAAKAARNVGACRLGEDPKGALQSFEYALAIWTERGDVREQADVLQAIADSYRRQGLSDRALSAFEGALPLAQKSGDRKLEASVWNAMATVYLSQGESGKVLECVQNALRLAREEKDLKAEAATLTTIGSLRRRRGELLLARSSFSDALGINQRLGDVANVAKVLVHLGGVHLDLGELDRARGEYDKALAVYRSETKDKEWEVNARLSLGQVHLKLGDPTTALSWFDSALAISRGENDRLAGFSLHSIGTVRLELGQTAEAIAALQEALPLRQKTHDRHGEAWTQVELGKAWQKQGDLETAESHLREALTLARQVETWAIEASALLGLARLHRDRGDLEGALAEIRQAVGILEAIRADLPEDSMRSSFFASKRPYYDFYVDLLMRLDGRFPGQGYASQALGASEAARSRSLLDLLAEGRLLTQGVSPELRKEEAELAGRLSAAQRRLLRELSAEKPDEAGIASLKALVDRIVQETRDLASTIRQEHPRYAEIRYPSPLGLPQIQERLDGETALLEYFLGEEGAYLFVATRETLTFYPLPRTGEIAELVAKVRRGLEAPSPRTFDGYTRAAHRLYEILIAPAMPALAGKSRLLIAPDGALHILAFEALLTEGTRSRSSAELPYLLRRFAVGYVPSASVLSRLAEPEARADAGGEPPLRFLAFTDPVYGSGEAGTPGSREGETGRGGIAAFRLSGLAGTGREVSAIAGRYPPGQVKVYQGVEANEENVKHNRLVETAHWLHFASHGLVDERQPELSGLLLTPTGGAEDDGLLQVYEIFNLSLRADLVVLSACETGLGKEVTGEGLVGLTRAFLYAGAPSVVVSLWRVRDDTTPELMVGLYDGLDRLGDKAEALREAKLAMIRTGNNAHPYYWAPFVLVGNPR